MLRSVLDLDDVQVSEIMTHKIAHVGPEAGIEKCMDIMGKRRIRHLPVVEKGKVLGGLSRPLTCFFSPFPRMTTSSNNSSATSPPDFEFACKRSPILRTHSKIHLLTAGDQEVRRNEGYPHRKVFCRIAGETAFNVEVSLFAPLCFRRN